MDCGFEIRQQKDSRPINHNAACGRGVSALTLHIHHPATTGRQPADANCR